jgi:uncharacterized membrane protein
MDYGDLTVEEFTDVFHKRRMIVNFTLSVLVITFLAAFTALAVTWNAKNLTLAQIDKFKRTRNKMLFGAILCGLAMLVGATALVLRVFIHGLHKWYLISAGLLVLTAGMGALFCMMTYVYARTKNAPKTSEKLAKRDRLLKSIIGIATVLIIIDFFILFISVGLSRETVMLLVQ